MNRHRPRLLFAVGLFALLFSGCAVVPYQFSSGDISPDIAKLAENEPQIERGEPYWFLDGIGHYLFSLPTKLILLNWSMENHDVSAETEAALAEYLKDNNLGAVKVRINQYSPGDEWSRLVDNKAVGWGWRYTVGVLSWLGYTIFPGRIFGGDHYNPFTNTINLFSDHPGVALHEGGHAKDFALTEWKGGYALLGLIPFSSLYFESAATGDAVGYMKEKNQRARERDSYKVLYPAYATYIGGELTSFITIFSPIDSVFGLVAVVPAHIAGRIKADEVVVPGEENGAQAPEADSSEQQPETTQPPAGPSIGSSEALSPTPSRPPLR